jgi:hypothetical protein
VSLSGNESMLEPHIADRINKLKGYLAAHFPEV